MKGRPRQGKEAKIHASIRIEPTVKKKLIKQFGSMQNSFEVFLKLLELKRPSEM